MTSLIGRRVGTPMQACCGRNGKPRAARLERWRSKSPQNAQWLLAFRQQTSVPAVRVEKIQATMLGMRLSPPPRLRASLEPARVTLATLPVVAGSARTAPDAGSYYSAAVELLAEQLAERRQE